ncbi:MAG: MerR family transcriptional regulator [Patescibacteria group bacterium]
MTYTVQKLATLAGISARTLHYYDEIGLLSPTRILRNGYRQYDEPELLKLQQIMFYRELEFPLEDIKKILENKNFDMQKALSDHRGLLELKQKRLKELLKTIDKTIKKISKKNNMKDDELYSAFDDAEMKQYAEEAKQRWGKTDAWKQSQERTKGWTKADYSKLKEDGDKWMKNFVLHMEHGHDSEIVQNLISEHYNSLRTFYEPNMEMYRGLAQMYVEDPRFAAYFAKYHPDLPTFFQKAIFFFCDNRK